MKKVYLLAVTVFLVIAGLLLSSGCKKSELGWDELPANVTWLLDRIVVSDSTTLDDDRTYWIKFQTGGTMSLQVDCNSCAGTYELSEGNSIKLLVFQCTLKLCAGGETITTYYRVALQDAFRYDVNGNQLILYYRSAAGISRLVFYRS
jgi:heat shock protein HslJ